MPALVDGAPRGARTTAPTWRARPSSRRLPRSTPRSRGRSWRKRCGTGSGRCACGRRRCSGKAAWRRAWPRRHVRPAAAGRPVADQEWQALVSPRFSPHAYIETDRGVIEIELAILDAPLTVANFVALARRGFFDGIAIHRVVPDFVVQDGDPRGDGEGGPGYTIRDEINMRPYLPGTVGMALDWKDTGGSQFFVTHSPQPHLDGRYTVFGHVVARHGRGGSPGALGCRFGACVSGTARPNPHKTPISRVANSKPRESEVGSS